MDEIERAQRMLEGRCPECDWENGSHDYNCSQGWVKSYKGKFLKGWETELFGRLMEDLKQDIKSGNILE